MNRTPTSPGEILREEFLKPLGFTTEAFAKRVGISPARLNSVLIGTHSVTPDIAQRLAEALGTTPEFWLAL